MCGHDEDNKKTHGNHMGAAAILSLEKMRAGLGGPFGAVVVRDGKIIGMGHNEVTSSNDPTAHAEIQAIRDACAKLETFNLSGAVIYTTCEPCPMCLSAIYWARLETVYYANTRADAARIGFDDAELYEEVAKDIDKRKIPMIKLTSLDSTLAFDEWENKTDKVEY